MKTTLRKLKTYNPCKEGWKTLLRNIVNDLDDELTIREILDSNGIEDAVWALRAVENQKKVRLFCADVAESVLGIYEEEHPNDNSLRSVIEATRRWADNGISEEGSRRAYKKALSLEVSSVGACNSAEEGAIYASCAIYAAYANNIAFAAYAATKAVSLSTGVSSEKGKWKKIEELLIKYLKG